MDDHTYELHGQIYRRNIPLYFMPQNYHVASDYKYYNYEDRHDEQISGFLNFFNIKLY